MAVPDLPAYPTNRGPVVAGNLRHQLSYIERQIARQEEALASLDTAFGIAFAAQDQRLSTQDRIYALANSTRKKTTP